MDDALDKMLCVASAENDVYYTRVEHTKKISFCILESVPELSNSSVFGPTQTPLHQNIIPSRVI